MSRTATKLMTGTGRTGDAAAAAPAGLRNLLLVAWLLPPALLARLSFRRGRRGRELKWRLTVSPINCLLILTHCTLNLVSSPSISLWKA
jgi:hypothetical protein